MTRFMGPTWGLPEADMTQVGPRWATWTLLSGKLQQNSTKRESCASFFFIHGTWSIAHTLCWWFTPLLICCVGCLAPGHIEQTRRLIVISVMNNEWLWLLFTIYFRVGEYVQRNRDDTILLYVVFTFFSIHQWMHTNINNILDSSPTLSWKIKTKTIIWHIISKAEIMVAAKSNVTYTKSTRNIRKHGLNWVLHVVLMIIRYLLYFF